MTQTKKLYQLIAGTIEALSNCQSGNKMARGNSKEWADKHEATLEYIAREFLPKGSGFDSGTALMHTFRRGQIKMHTSYHHMTENGYYEGWSEHDVTVTPDWNGINIRVGGRDKNNIKEYIHQVFMDCLTLDVYWSLIEEQWKIVRLTDKPKKKEVVDYTIIGIDYAQKERDTLQKLSVPNTPEELAEFYLQTPADKIIADAEAEAEAIGTREQCDECGGVGQHQRLCSVNDFNPLDFESVNDFDPLDFERASRGNDSEGLDQFEIDNASEDESV